MEKWRKQLVEDNLKLVNSIAHNIKNYLPENLDVHELISMGTLGLTQAAENYKPELGYRFSTYAYYRIQGSIYDELRKTVWKPYFKALKAREAASSYLAGEAKVTTKVKNKKESFKTLANQLSGISTIFIMAKEDAIPNSSSLGQEPENGFDNCRKQEIAKVVQDSLSKIKPVYRLIIEEYYFKNKSFLEISKERGRSKAWAWSMHNRAIKDMKKHLGSATFNLENFI